MVVTLSKVNVLSVASSRQYPNLTFKFLHKAGQENWSLGRIKGLMPKYGMVETQGRRDLGK